ncbi:diacylglycerol kinase [Erysipelothrix urinaevulpis]|uniref:diacylglycerol kinase n=1 Tax=Erysipelothrix urinaevulpis TaxID=2683717 RepID=UPI00135C0280|nr:diacylglycerol kinase [Erysipelothrix urinaevulpis]
MITQIIQKFANAFEGLKTALKNDPSIILQFIIASITMIFFVFIKISWLEWLFVLTAIFIVLITEFINSTLEDMCDLLVNRYDLQVKGIKDMAAAAVLLAAVYALIVAGVIILRRLL